MMEDADKTTAEEIQMNPTEKSSGGCTTAFYFFQCRNHRPVMDSFRLRWSPFTKKQLAIKAKKKEK